MFGNARCDRHPAAAGRRSMTGAHEHLVVDAMEAARRGDARAARDRPRQTHGGEHRFRTRVRERRALCSRSIRTRSFATLPASGGSRTDLDADVPELRRERILDKRRGMCPSRFVPKPIVMIDVNSLPSMSQNREPAERSTIDRIDHFLPILPEAGDGAWIGEMGAILLGLNAWSFGRARDVARDQRVEVTAAGVR